MDWSRGYGVLSWHLYEVDVRTWADGPELPRVLSATVERTLGRDEDAPLLESGTIEVLADPSEGFEERHVRLAMVAEQAGEVVRVDVATLVAMSKGGTVERGADRMSLDCRSVLWPASVGRVAPGTWCPSGTDGAAWAADLLAGCVMAPVSVEGTFTVDADVVMDLGASALECAWRVLRAGDFVASVDGGGRVRVGPRRTAPDLPLDEAGARLLSPSVSHDLDWSGVPNRWRAVDGDVVAEATNVDPTSPTSYVLRGYWHDGDGIDDSPLPVDGEGLYGYCARKLEEASVVLDSRSYTRKFWPGVGPGSLVRATLPGWGMEGDLRVQRQTLDCGNGILVTEEAAREVAAWVRS